MTTDGGLYRLFKDNVPGHWVRVESGWTSTGVPDAEYCVDGATGWVEFKEARGGRVTIRTLQSSFAEARAAAGGRVTLAVKVDRGILLYDGSAMRRMLLDPRSRPVKGGKSCPLAAAEPALASLPGALLWPEVARYLRR